jgi:flavin reductase (DIM6/NTAB) family NADH-FMN oxidoreductase RutF
MNKKIFESSPWSLPILCVHPVILVGAILDGHPDFATVAWTGVAASVPPSIAISLQPHRHSLKGIKQNMAFSVNVPSIDQLKEVDYCGLVSGAITDKAKDCNFKIFYGNNKSAPLIDQFTINHVCQVSHILCLGSHEMVIGKIVETYISEDYLCDGKLNVEKASPYLFSLQKYYKLGELIDKGFTSGREINPAKVEESRKHFPLRSTG